MARSNSGVPVHILGWIVAGILSIALIVFLVSGNNIPSSITDLPTGTSVEKTNKSYAEELYDEFSSDPDQRKAKRQEFKREAQEARKEIDEDSLSQGTLDAINAADNLLENPDPSVEELEQFEAVATAAARAAEQRIKELERKIAESEENQLTLENQIKELEENNDPLSEAEKKEREQESDRLKKELEEERKKNEENKKKLDTEKKILKYLKLALQIGAVFAFAYGQPELGAALLASAAYIGNAANEGEGDSDTDNAPKSGEDLSTSSDADGNEPVNDIKTPVEGVAATEETKAAIAKAVESGMTAVSGTGGGTVFMVTNETLLEIHDSSQTPTLQFKISIENITPLLKPDEQPSQFLSMKRDGEKKTVSFKAKNGRRIDLSSSSSGGIWSKATDAELTVDNKGNRE